ncbi:MAG: hypothetical protein WC495_05500 [Patescibacteria group bacterium]|jgi:guanylate kinase
MRALEHCVTELLAASAFGKIIEVTPGTQCVFVLSNPNLESLDSLWVSLVLNLTKKGLIRGILDVPMMQHTKSGVIWVKDFRVLCIPSATVDFSHLATLNHPALPPALTLAVGGPAGVGKTTVIRHLLASHIGKQIRRYVAYTTRRARSHEVNGIDYHFIDPSNFASYHANSRYTDFVESRGYWYWIDPLNFFKERWMRPYVIHLFTITQVHEFLARRELTPDLRWIWLEASSNVLERRLEARGDLNLAQSIAQNQRLVAQDRSGLISLQINTEVESISDSSQQLLNYIRESLEEI